LSYEQGGEKRLRTGYNGGESVMVYVVMAGLALFVLNSVDINLNILA